MRRLLVLALVVAIGCKGKENTSARDNAVRSTAAGDAVLTRVKSAIGAALPGASIQVDGDMLRISSGPGSDAEFMQLTLDNIRRSCASSEGECTAAIDNIVENTKKAAAAANAKDEAPPDKATIRLTPKPTEWVEGADKQTSQIPDHADDNKMVRQKFAGDLWWLYVYDLPSGMQMINTKELKALGMTQQELHALAVANLAKQYPKLEFTELTPGMWTIEPGDYMDSARLALTEQWRAEAKKRGGKLLVSAPARSRVFVTNEPKLRAGFDTITKKAFTEEDHPLTEAVLEWTDKGWTEESH